MATTVVMPQMGYDMREGKVVKWRHKEGDQVKRGEVIAEIETDKAVVEMEASAAGVLARIIASEGQSIPVGEPIAIITALGESVPETFQPKATALTAQKAPSVQVTAPPAAQAAATVQAQPAAPSGEIKTSPLARRMAAEKGIDLTQVKGTGPGGRITEKDVLDYEAQVKAAPAAAPVASPAAVTPGAKRIGLTKMRQAIASVTLHSKRETPHFYVTAEVDMGESMTLRKQLNETTKDVHVSVNDLLVKAAVKTLEKHPKFNASFKGDHLEMHDSINIGMAIALEQGLMVLAIPNCQGKSLVEIAKASRDLIERAQAGKLRAEEYTGSTFAISNLGMYDVDSFAAIIFPPNAAVLAVGTVKKQPVVRNDQIVIGQIMKATISVDHRVADGAEAARFMVDLKNFLEHPLLMLV